MVGLFPSHSQPCPSIHTHTQTKFTLRSLVDISHGKIEKKTIFKKKNSNSTQDEDCEGNSCSHGRRTSAWKQRRDTYPLPSPIADRNRIRGRQSAQTWLGMFRVKGSAGWTGWPYEVKAACSSPVRRLTLAAIFFLTRTLTLRGQDCVFKPLRRLTPAAIFFLTLTSSHALITLTTTQERGTRLQTTHCRVRPAASSQSSVTELPHFRCVPTTVVSPARLGRRGATPTHRAATWEDLPALERCELPSPPPQIWLIPGYISSHTGLLSFITHVDFKSVIS